MLQLLICSLLTMSIAMGAEVKIFSWNVFMLPKPIKYSRQKERTPLIIEHLKSQKPDVILLQESFSSYFHQNLSYTLNRTHPYRIRLPKLGSIKARMDSGLMILSRYPFKYLGSAYYGTCSSFDCFSSKGLILVEVNVNGSKLQVATTHMQAGETSVDGQVRRDQLRTIRSLLDRHKKPGVPQILAGDLNMDSMIGAEFKAALTYLGLSSTGEDELASSKSRNTKCFGQKNSSRLSRLDHVLSRDLGQQNFSIETAIVTPKDYVQGSFCDLSDHYAMSTKISFGDLQ